MAGAKIARVNGVEGGPVVHIGEHDSAFKEVPVSEAMFFECLANQSHHSARFGGHTTGNERFSVLIDSDVAGKVKTSLALLPR